MGVGGALAAVEKGVLLRAGWHRTGGQGRDTQEHRHRNMRTHARMRAHLCTHRHTDTQTHRHADTQTHRHTDSVSALDPDGLPTSGDAVCRGLSEVDFVSPHPNYPVQGSVRSSTACSSNLYA